MESMETHLPYKLERQVARTSMHIISFGPKKQIERTQNARVDLFKNNENISAG
jgi:hypothetical protein